MDVSVVIATHNQKERLRLVLAGLRVQRFPASRFEVIVVDDGCTDGTVAMLDEVGPEMPLQIVSLSLNQGRCQARNQGVREAQGERIAFLDGDALPHPEWLQHHWEAFEQYGPDGLLCGGEYSLPELEYLQDPQTGALMDGPVPSVVREYVRQHRDEMILTEEVVVNRFEQVHARAKEGGYPFPELQAVQEQTRELFAEQPDSPIGWIGFYPHNGMIPKLAFEQVGGFDGVIPFSEGGDLAYRLQRAGIRPGFVPAARTYHLYHYHAFSDPRRASDETLTRGRALAHMVRKNQDPRLWLLPFWQAGLWPDPFLPEELVLEDLIAFHRRYQEISSSELRHLQQLLHRHPIRSSWSEGSSEE